MRRDTLIFHNQRQLALVRTILARQPLLARLSRHRQFLQAPALPNLPGLPASQAIPDSPAYPLPVISRHFLTPVIQETDNTGNNEYLQSDAATDPVGAQFIAPTADDESSQKHALTYPAGADLSAPSATGVTEADLSTVGAINRRLRGDSPADETLAETEIIREIEREAPPEVIHEPLTEQQEDAQPPVSLDAPAQTASNDMHTGRDEAVPTQQQVESDPTDEPVPPPPGAQSPVETVRPRRQRRHIEELTAQARPSPSTPTTKRETPGPKRNAQAPQARQRPETAGENEIRADELFLPANTDRSPQAWLARLTGKSLPAQVETTPHSLPEGKSLPATPDNETPVARRSTARPQQSNLAVPALLSASDASEATGVADDSGRDASLSLSMTRSPLSMTRPENDLPSDEQAQSQPLMTGRPTPERQEGQSQQQIAQANNLRAVAAIPGAPTTARIPTTPEMAKTAPPVQTRQAEPLSSRTRRFLRPLLGIDPASVQIHRDAQAARLAAAYNADAITQGNQVELAAEHARTMDTPETLGLLAHELTHVARQRQPGFVPPIAQTRTDNAPQTRRPVSTPNPATMDEETLALHVERRVKQTAEGTASLVGPPLAGGLLDSPGLHGAAGSEAPENRRPDNDPWGGLPAPWEPLPAWLTAPAPPVTMEESAASLPASVPVAPPVQPVASNQTNGQARPEVQRAARGRSTEETVLSASAPPTQEVDAPEPDLDELARQVYSILRNRLEVERRRHR